MLLPIHRTVCVFTLLGVLVATSGQAGADEPAPKKQPLGDFTHVVITEADYYTSGPQQGRPPDGRLNAGTKVRLLRSVGSYSQVQTEDGAIAYVATDALREKGADAVKITDEVRAVAESSNQFALDLYRHLREVEGNLFFSPASVSTALAMTYAGAEGQTQEQMASVLHFEMADAQLHDGFGTLSDVLNASSEAYELSMANRLWGQATLPFRPEFLETTRKVYGAELAELDFGNSEDARQQINTWVAEQTAGKIENLIPMGALNAETRLVLTNAIYFKGAWDDEFSEDATQDAPFHVSPERQIDAPLMHQTDDFRYAETDDLQLLELPYAGNDLSMVIFLPRKVDGLADVEGELSAQSVQQWMDGMRKQEVEVYLPKFTMSSQLQMAYMLRTMGMALAFSGEADFSGISTADDLMLSEVIHQAFVDVNEKGTEAAAATAVFAPTAAPPGEDEPVVFRADHPFLFSIRDNRTGALLFLGRVVNPAE